MAAYEVQTSKQILVLSTVSKTGAKKKRNQCPLWTNGVTNTIRDQCLSVETELPLHTEAGGALAQEVFGCM